MKEVTREESKKFVLKILPEAQIVLLKKRFAIVACPFAKRVLVEKCLTEEFAWFKAAGALGWRGTKNDYTGTVER